MKRITHDVIKREIYALHEADEVPAAIIGTRDQFTDFAATITRDLAPYLNLFSSGRTYLGLPILEVLKEPDHFVISEKEIERWRENLARGQRNG